MSLFLMSYLGLSNDSLTDIPKVMQQETLDHQFQWIAAQYSGYLKWPCVVSSILLLHYVTLYLTYRREQKHTENARIPPLVPHIFPVIGSVFSFLWDQQSFVMGATSHAGKYTVSGVRLMGRDIYLVQGEKNIQAVWKSASLSTPTFVLSYALGTFFGASAKAVAMFDRDDSGIADRPSSGNIVEPHNRIDYKTHGWLGKLLMGVGLQPLFDRFQTNLSTMIQDLEIQDDWIAMPDLWLLMRQDLTPCIMNALCGPTLLEENPEFVADFWQFNLWLPILSKGVPRLFIPQGYAYRDKLVNAVKKWHTVARQGFQSESKSIDYEPFWGYMRQRQELYLGVDNFDDRDVASADLGMIWATNTNAVTATFWTILEIFKDQDLLARVREEVVHCIDQTPSGEKIDVHKILKQPLLQSIYAEVLRTRAHVYVTRGSQSTTSRIKEWILPRGKVVLIPTTPSHFDPESWYKGEDKDHPVDKFWADRFLVDSEKDIKFSMERSKGLWFPYGGGARMCPGRHFAKREIMLTAAQFAHSLDIRIKAINGNPRMKQSDFGLGVIGPADAVPFEIRRRHKGTDVSKD